MATLITVLTSEGEQLDVKITNASRKPSRLRKRLSKIVKWEVVLDVRLVPAEDESSLEGICVVMCV